MLQNSCFVVLQCRRSQFSRRDGSSSSRNVSAVKSVGVLVQFCRAAWTWDAFGNWTNERRAVSAARILACFFVGPRPSKWKPSTSTPTQNTGACSGPVLDVISYRRPGRNSFSCTSAFFWATAQEVLLQVEWFWRSSRSFPSTSGCFLFRALGPCLEKVVQNFDGWYLCSRAQSTGIILSSWFSFTSKLLVPVERSKRQESFCKCLCVSETFQCKTFLMNHVLHYDDKLTRRCSGWVEGVKSTELSNQRFKVDLRSTLLRRRYPAVLFYKSWWNKSRPKYE